MGKAGGAFNLMTFLKQPITALRLLSWVFAVVVLGCVTNEGYVNRPDSALELCVFNGNAVACRYSIATATLGLVWTSVFLGLDLYFHQIKTVQDRKRTIQADILITGLWSCLWFVDFCFLSNQWQFSRSEDNPLNEGVDAARAAILFCFLSVFTSGGLTLLSVERMKRVTFEEEYNKLFSPPQA